MYDMQKKMVASRDDYDQRERCKYKRMTYARDQQVSMLESDGQLLLEKCEYWSE